MAFQPSRDEQSLWMAADRHIVANIVVAVRRFHIDVAREAAVWFPRRWMASMKLAIRTPLQWVI